MKIWLDDWRPAPEGWEHVLTVRRCEQLIEDGGVTEISLDNDLGACDTRTGEEVVDFLEQRLRTHGIRPPHVHIHTGSPGAAVRMRSKLRGMEGIADSNLSGEG